MHRAGRVASFTVSGATEYTCDDINSGLDARFVVISIVPIPCVEHLNGVTVSHYEVFYRRSNPMEVGLFGERFRK